MTRGISTRRARKLRAYVIRKIAMKRELDAYLRQSYAAEAASSNKWEIRT